MTAYAYEYCDNDSYNEIALSIVTNKPGKSNLGPISLVGQSMSKDFWGYVLKLPVNTELARGRGVVGYNLSKWLTGINLRETDKSVVFEILDSQIGKVDVTLETEKLGDLSSEVDLITNSFTNIGHSGELNYGYAISRQMSHASSTSEDTVKLTLSDRQPVDLHQVVGSGRDDEVRIRARVPERPVCTCPIGIDAGR